jgi:hypothetical protein
VSRAIICDIGPLGRSWHGAQQQQVVAEAGDEQGGADTDICAYPP